MATKRMLIDASHPEETRVVVLEGTRLEDYDVEVASRRQLRGNIYLAKVIRVEPSLQAAFVEYGGNRHGFLAFSEIHPDYYQIPVADRQALLAEQEARERAERAQLADEPAAEAGESEQNGGEEGEPVDIVGGDSVDVIGGDDDEELERRPARSLSRNYKIQEVIKRRQILLVQAVKEERGNKGAALTTYLSLAGRYCVLMPNTSRGGGISRKIANLPDRKRLKKILAELEVPDGMGVIVRTAGSGRTKAEIKRDYEYLMRLWSNIREMTLSSIAPTLVYEEGSLIKRSIRDLYDRDTEEIVIQGEAPYRIAKEFMKLFIPSHAKRVKLHDDSERPLFTVYQVENQLDAMHLPTVQLKSGGYIVINPTEALVSIDVNSGRATRERHIEETALKTNVEAADEVARQLRLRDLAGLIVIDFIDMENSRNQGQVERRLKEAMKNERARIQLGRISPFGLLELSRQRLRPSLLETSFETCPYCSGMGLCRTTESTVLSILRKIEEEGMRAKGGSLTVTASPTVAMYLLNQKRKTLAKMETRFGLSLIMAADGSFAPAEHRLSRVNGPAATEAAADGAASEDTPTANAETETEAETEMETASAADEPVETANGGEAEEGAKRGRRRRPRRRRHTDDDSRSQAATRNGDAGEFGDDGELSAGDTAEDALATDDEGPDGDRAGNGAGNGNGGELTSEQAAQDANHKRRRRGKRGGRRRPRRPDDEALEPVANGDADTVMAASHGDEYGEGPGDDDDTDDDAFEPAAGEDGDAARSATDEADEGEGGVEASEPRGRRRPRRRRAKAAAAERETGRETDVGETPFLDELADAPDVSADGDVDVGAASEEVLAAAVENSQFDGAAATAAETSDNSGVEVEVEADVEAFEIVRYETPDSYETPNDSERETWHLPAVVANEMAAEDVAPEAEAGVPLTEAEPREEPLEESLEEPVHSGGNGHEGAEAAGANGEDGTVEPADAAHEDDDPVEAQLRDSEAAAAAARTNVIRVGADTDGELHESPRKGWWQRFVN